MKRYLAYAGLLTALAGSANAAHAADSTDDSLTWYGITLYGTIDVGYTYQNRGTPRSDYFTAGLQYYLRAVRDDRATNAVASRRIAPVEIPIAPHRC